MFLINSIAFATPVVAFSAYIFILSVEFTAGFGSMKKIFTDGEAN